MNGAPVGDGLPFDTTTLVKIIDYVTYDAVHNLPLLDDASLRPDVTSEVRHWAQGVVEAIGKLEDCLAVLSHIVSSLSTGLTSTERFACGSLICEPLFRAIERDVEELSRHDCEAQVRQELQRLLNRRHKKLKLSGPPASVDDLLPALEDCPLSRFYFAPSSHVVGLQNCLLENQAVPGFHCAEEYLQQALGYMTHLVFKVFREVRNHSTSLEISFENVAMSDEELQAAVKQSYESLRPLFCDRYRYSAQVFLSTGVQVLSEKQQHTEAGGTGLDPDNHPPPVRKTSSLLLRAASVYISPQATQSQKVNSSVMSMVRIHDGLSLDDVSYIIQDVQEAVASLSHSLSCSPVTPSVPGFVVHTTAR